MELFLNILLLAIGFVALIKGADFFVDGSSSLARRFRVPGVIIGLTVVAMGTSAPELAVSTSAAISGSNEIALSNVVGSNMFNLLAVLGVCALISPLSIDRTIIKRDFPLSIGVTVALLAAVAAVPLFAGGFSGAKMSDNVGELSRPAAIVLLLIFIVYITLLILNARRSKTEDDGKKPLALWKSLLLIAVGLACIIIGGNMVVNSAKTIAAIFGMSETLIGLTIVAVGTSLPELVTSIVASRKGENGLAVGNAVGSNLFNILLILGVSGTIHPIAVNFASITDLVILTGMSLLTWSFAMKGKINRPKGAVMLAVYIAYVVFAAVR